MKNTVKARVNFSFRGENLSPELVIDLDELLEAGQDFSRLFEQMAQANGIDSYSYEYEVMESCAIEFSEVTGIAKDFLHASGEFDLDGFREKWSAGQSDQMLMAIAREHMKVNSLNEIDGLAAALRAAYDAGAASSR